MIRAAVCDDEKESRNDIIFLIRKQPFPCEIVEYASAEECLSDNKGFDLLFLDIELDAAGTKTDDKGMDDMSMDDTGMDDASRDRTGPDDMESDSKGQDGMALAREFRRREKERQPVIIFVTGYDRYVFDAFEVDAFQYLVKPVEEEKFARVFARAAERIMAEKENRQRVRGIKFKSAGTVRNLAPDDIYYIESSDHKVTVHLKDGEFSCYAKIRDLEEELQDRFFRIHKGYLVNLSCVERYSRTEAVLVNREKLPVSKYKYREFVKAYLRFLKKETNYE